MTFLLAAWAHHLRAVDTLAEDPLAARLVPLARRAHRDARPLLLGCPGLDDLAGEPAIVAGLQQALSTLETVGVRAALGAVSTNPLTATAASRALDSSPALRPAELTPAASRDRSAGARAS